MDLIQARKGRNSFYQSMYGMLDKVSKPSLAISSLPLPCPFQRAHDLVCGLFQELFSLRRTRIVLGLLDSRCKIFSGLNLALALFAFFPCMSSRAPGASCEIFSQRPQIACGGIHPSKAICLPDQEASQCVCRSSDNHGHRKVHCMGLISYNVRGILQSKIFGGRVSLAFQQNTGRILGFQSCQTMPLIQLNVK